MSKLRLDLGCGPQPRDGYDGVDIVDGLDVWAVGDLERIPWYLYPADGTRPEHLKDDSVEALFSSHLVEHIRDLVGFMREAHRVLEPDGLFEIHHPYQFNVRAWQDPTHVRCLNEVSWFYFDKKWRGGTENTWGEYGDTDFELMELDAIPTPEWLHVAQDNPEDFERAAHNQINVISDLHVILKCRK